MASHHTLPGTDIYGPGTFIDKEVLPVPVDARRDRAAWDTVRFTGGSEPMIPIPIKAPVVAAALHAMCGLVANELLELRDGTAVHESTVALNTDHAGLWLGSTFTTQINGEDVSTLARSNALASRFDRDFEQGSGKGLAGRATAIYQTKDPRVWNQLHSSLDATRTLQSMGIPTDVKFDTMREYYDYIQSYVIQWSPDELKMHNVRHGLCGSICYSPEGWRRTAMGQRLAAHPLVNYTCASYAAPTPPVPVPLPKRPSVDRRPLAGVKVLEMVRIIAGPTIGVTLASYGADVIRVNCSKLADLNVLQLTLNAGKRTIDLDIAKVEDKARLLDLLAEADIFVQGFRPGSLARQGLDLHRMLEHAAMRNKDIIYVDENCYGPDGAFAERPGWQQIGDAAFGTSYVMGRAQAHETVQPFETASAGYSVLPPLPVSDMTTGLVGALAAMMAVRDRTTQGGSYHVVSSLVAADAVALEPEIGLHPPAVVARTAQRFGAATWTSNASQRMIAPLLFK
ncbi:CoA-transferase family III [Aspergillus japonicus CBS 114.51]|uniref:CoA-transferase family III n=1 Tax=Aspergillus japonicus CBS 114.51 TaxID=1448312 RepID=A0A8T8X924_ASPJA|nr:CoA-transferase family III [Aspergillus japonicus CBS 114.51]RAH84667.1 CoA-transferase family III [Aspergillus japonicus CBS 114.51]